MIELHLIGYTEDGEQLVFDLDADGEGRYCLAVDPDLLATVAALRAERVRRGRPVDERPVDERPVAPPAATTAAVEPASAAAASASEPVVVDADGRRPQPRDQARTSAPTRGRWTRPAPAPAARTTPVRTPSPAREATAATAARVPDVAAADVEVTAARAPDVAAADSEAAPAEADAPSAAAFDHRPSARAEPRAALSPAEIQRQLRAGRSVAAVAADAGVEAAWVERWLPPILAERERVLRDALVRTVDGTRDRLGDRVAAAFAARGIPDEETSWTAARRADGRWRVSVRYRDGGRARTATWTVRDEGGPIRPASPAAAELAPPPAGRRR